ncbi:MAG TPA: peptidoglycan-binding domain-containing protein, partial [Candidatus Paceibacterota bacterium]|nr:peptidoglycan-binding domain-containing protein [Candidatus Paceibacterota bacterium]
DSSLSENTQYTYDVQFNDSVGNTGSYGTVASKYTLTDTPTNLSASSDTDSVTLAVDSFPNDTSGQSGYYFSRSGANSGWIQTNSWTDTGVSCSHSYTYSLKYRNGDGLESDSISLTQTAAGCRSSSGGTVQSQISNLLAMGNTELANELQDQYQLPPSLPLLLAKVIALKAEIARLQALASPSCLFTRDLTLNTNHPEVKCLQQYLNTHDYPVSSTGPGSPNHETTYFGSLTKQALIKFQQANNIKPAVGYFGPITRALVSKAE